MLAYIPSLATVVLALMQLTKDWGAHQTHWRRALVLIAITLLGVGGAINTHYANKRSFAQQTTYQNQIAGLEGAVKTANANQEANTKQFVKSFGDLSQQLGDLKTQLKTAGLQKEAVELQRQLESTQKALLVPQAELVPSLGKVSENLDNLVVTQTFAPVKPDGTVEFAIDVVNKSDIQAKNGSIYVRICKGCAYAKEPTNSRRNEGADNTDRDIPFERLTAKTGIDIPLKLTPPSDADGLRFGRRFEVDVHIRCENCVMHPKHVLWISY